MEKIKKFVIEEKTLILIIAIAIFFRTYALIDRFEFAHDGDLYSWIVKDIIVEKHLRLIGQQTTAPGIFIGPLFYYMLIPFFLLFSMDPVGAVIPITLLGIITVISYYLVFSQLFNKKIGSIAAFLYSVLLTNVIFMDRRVVPSTLTNIWLVWYFWAIVKLLRKDYSVFPILGLLTGLIWHIHIALFPALLAIPTAILFAQKLPSPKHALGFLIGFFIPSIPLFLFEIKHGFIQTKSLLNNFVIDHGGGTGWNKFLLITIKLSDNIVKLLFYPQTISVINHTLFSALILLSAFFLVKKKLLDLKELLLFYIWIAGIFLYYTFSSVIISEYYFTNVEIIFLTIISLFFYLLYQTGQIGKKLIILVFAFLFIKNISYLIKGDYYYAKGYKERKAVIEFIAGDARNKNFPCVAISFITSPGENVGFRYFIWLNKLRLSTPQKNVPIYTIVLPAELSQKSIAKSFGHIGVILPQSIPEEQAIKSACSGDDINLTEPMLGFTK